MKSNPLTTILLAILAVSALWSAILCVQFIRNSRELGGMRGDLGNIANRQNIDQAVLNEAVAYSSNHPAINPVLEAIGYRKPVAAPAPPAAPTASPSPARR
jgi:hypothetical protein